MYLIIEVCDRELCSVNAAPTINDAVKTANTVLEQHCCLIGQPEAYDKAEAAVIDTGDLEQDGIKFSTQDSPDAWCNFKDKALDVFVTRINGGLSLPDSQTPADKPAQTAAAAE